jgi:hypothetical protein
MGATNVSNFRTQIVDVTLTLDAATHAAGDIVADFQKFDVVGAARAQDIHIRGTINDVKVVDKDDQGIEMDVIFAQSLDTAAPTLGTEGSAVSISDANAAKIIGVANISSYTDLINSQYGQPSSFTPIGFNISNSNYLYVGAVTRGTPTYTASGVVLRLNITVE